MSLEALFTMAPIAIIMFSGAWMVLNQPLSDYPLQESVDIQPGAPQNATEPQTEFHEVECIINTFNATGEAIIERYIYNQTADVCWRFTREFRKHNPEWSELTLGIGENFGAFAHSVAYLRRNKNSAYVHDAWGGDTFVLEFDEAGNFTMWNHIENNTKVFDTRNAEWLSQYDHFHFGTNDTPTTIRALTQDNRQAFIKGEI